MHVHYSFTLFAWSFLHPSPRNPLPGLLKVTALKAVSNYGNWGPASPREADQAPAAWRLIDLCSPESSLATSDLCKLGACQVTKGELYLTELENCTLPFYLTERRKKSCITSSFLLNKSLDPIQQAKLQHQWSKVNVNITSDKSASGTYV